MLKKVFYYLGSAIVALGVGRLICKKHQACKAKKAAVSSVESAPQ